MAVARAGGWDIVTATDHVVDQGAVIALVGDRSGGQGDDVQSCVGALAISNASGIANRGLGHVHRALADGAAIGIKAPDETWERSGRDRG